MSAPMPVEELEKLLRAAPDGTRLYHPPVGASPGRALSLVAANSP